MMKLHKQATKGHLTAGAIMVFLSLTSLTASFFLQSTILAVSVFFFGVWGGVEIGRYPEYKLSQSDGHDHIPYDSGVSW